MFPFPTFMPGAKKLVLIDRTVGTNFGDFTAYEGLPAAFDGITNVTVNGGPIAWTGLAGIRKAWIGKHLISPRCFGKAKVYGSSDQGFMAGTRWPMIINIKGKIGAAPANTDDGTVIGSISFTSAANESAGREIVSSDLSTKWDHLWAEYQTPANNSNYFCAELQLYAWE